MCYPKSTTFHIHLRGLSDAMASDTAPGELHLAHGGHAQRVLYIDDDASLAATVQRLEDIILTKARDLRRSGVGG